MSLKPVATSNGAGPKEADTAPARINFMRQARVRTLLRSDVGCRTGLCIKRGWSVPGTYPLGERCLALVLMRGVIPRT